MTILPIMPEFVRLIVCIEFIEGGGLLNATRYVLFQII